MCGIYQPVEKFTNIAKFSCHVTVVSLFYYKTASLHVLFAVSYTWNQLNVNTELKLTSVPPKQKREDENFPPNAVNMPGDFCKHSNKIYIYIYIYICQKVNIVKQYKCDICFLYVYTYCF